MRAAVINVGDEIILGEQANTNQQWMLNLLQQYGIFCESAIVLPDLVSSIAGSVMGLRQNRIHHIFISGGIGGTHDDVTREGVARGLNRKLVLHTECEGILKSRYGDRFNEQRRRMAFLPEGSSLIPNALGAPGFAVEGIFGLPGFPRMLPSMMEFVLRESLGIHPGVCNGLQKVEALLDCTEGDIALKVEDFLKKCKYEIKVGIYPNAESSQVLLRGRFKAEREDLHIAFNELVFSLSKLTRS